MFMGRPALDLTGKVFDRLTVLYPTGADAKQQRLWKCRCSCGVEVVRRASRLNKGHRISCGCLRDEGNGLRMTTHGQASGDKSPCYRSWISMKARCTNPTNPRWQQYGGRGITYDPSWEKFENFHADMGERPYGLTLDRKNNNGDYTKANCRWSTLVEQARNKSNNLLITAAGRTQALSAWCSELNLPYARVYKRLVEYGWSPEDALHP